VPASIGSATNSQIITGRAFGRVLKSAPSSSALLASRLGSPAQGEALHPDREGFERARHSRSAHAHGSPIRR
jgi:hypothetical protein